MFLLATKILEWAGDQTLKLRGQLALKFFPKSWALLKKFFQHFHLYFSICYQWLQMALHNSFDM